MAAVRKDSFRKTIVDVAVRNGFSISSDDVMILIDDAEPVRVIIDVDVPVYADNQSQIDDYRDECPDIDFSYRSKILNATVKAWLEAYISDDSEICCVVELRFQYCERLYPGVTPTQEVLHNIIERASVELDRVLRAVKSLMDWGWSFSSPFPRGARHGLGQKDYKHDMVRVFMRRVEGDGV